MKIGLVRHFKVELAYPKKFLIGAEELTQFFVQYDSAGITYAPVDLLGVEWKRCYSSSAPRAIKTAETIYKGEITTADELRELNVLPLLQHKSRRPLLLWALQMRSHAFKSNEITDRFKQNLVVLLEKILAESPDDLLLVSHGFVMMHLQKELRKRGFAGKGFGTPVNGKVYVFEN